MSPDISVIIPTYNRATLLPQALDSVFAQTGVTCEVIVVDDASTDNSLERLKDYKDRPLRILRHERNRGGAAARNTGMAAAQGEYIAFLDSDDSWREGKLSKQLALFHSSANEKSRKPLGLVYTGYQKHNSRAAEQQTLRGDIFPEILIQNCVGTTSTVLVRRDALLRVGGFDEQLPSCQDWDLWIRLAKEYRFDCIPEPLVDYYRQPDSISANRQATRRGHQLVVEKYSNELKSLTPEQRGRCYFNLGRVFWWKRELGSASAWFAKALCADPAQLASLWQLLVLRPIAKRLGKPSVKEHAELRVLHLIEHLQVGGAERLLVDLLNEQTAPPLSSQLLLYRGRGELATQVPSSCRLHLWCKDFLSRDLQHWPRPLLQPVIGFETALFVIRLIKLLRQERISILHCQMFSANCWGIIAARLAGVKVIATEHTIRQRQSAKRRLLNRWLLPLAQRVVAVTAEVAQSIRQEQRLAPGRLVVIRNGIRPEDYRLPAEQAGRLKTIRTLRIGAVGRLIAEKRLDRFIQLIAACRQRYPEVRGVIIGAGPEQSKLEMLVRDLALKEQVQFLGQRQDIAEQLSQLDLLINCSDREGLSRAILEAMAAGLPVIATAVGGNGDLIHDGVNGRLVAAEDPDEMLRAVIQIHENPDLAKQFAEQAYQRVLESYSLSRMATEWQRLYQEVLDGCR
ncbi:MAG TPA: glycosyltransferase [Malonomonas sp.]